MPSGRRGPLGGVGEGVADQSGDHPADPVTLPQERCGVDDPLHMVGLDVLTGDSGDDRGRFMFGASARSRSVTSPPPRVAARPVPLAWIRLEETRLALGPDARSRRYAWPVISLRFASLWLHTGSFGADMCRRLWLLDLS